MAIEQGTKEWRELTFSQREELAPLPEPLQAGVLPKQFRNKIWQVVDANLSDCVVSYMYPEGENGFEDSKEGKFFGTLLDSFQDTVWDLPHDEIEIMVSREVKKFIRDLILDVEGHETLTFIEFMLRRSNIPKSLSDQIKNCFDDAPYIFDCSSESICIIPIASEEAKKNIKRSLDNINQSKLVGSKSHLRNAAEQLNKNNFADCIRESIHAVEAAARQIDPKASKDLSVALNSLEKNGIFIHPALKDAFKKLYGYTSDEEGIRHSLIGQESANVGFDEAIFMYSACVAFVDYLVGKHKQTQEK